MFADPHDPLSPNFRVHEFTKSQWATRHRINNSLPAELLMNAVRTATHIAQPVRDHFGIPMGISSGYRCLALNRLLKSDDTSDHVQACAADLEVPGIDNLVLAYWMADNLEFDQLIIEHYDPDDGTGGWVHGSFRSRTANRQQVLTYHGGANPRFENGLPGRLL